MEFLLSGQPQGYIDDYSFRLWTERDFSLFCFSRTCELAGGANILVRQIQVGRDGPRFVVNRVQQVQGFDELSLGPQCEIPCEENDAPGLDCEAFKHPEAQEL